MCNTEFLANQVVEYNPTYVSVLFMYRTVIIIIIVNLLLLLFLLMELVSLYILKIIFYLPSYTYVPSRVRNTI